MKKIAGSERTKKQTQEKRQGDSLLRRHEKILSAFNRYALYPDETMKKDRRESARKATEIKDPAGMIA